MNIISTSLLPHTPLPQIRYLTSTLYTHHNNGTLRHPAHTHTHTHSNTAASALYLLLARGDKWTRRLPASPPQLPVNSRRGLVHVFPPPRIRKYKIRRKSLIARPYGTGNARDFYDNAIALGESFAFSPVLSGYLLLWPRAVVWFCANSPRSCWRECVRLPRCAMLVVCEFFGVIGDGTDFKKGNRRGNEAGDLCLGWILYLTWIVWFEIVNFEVSLFHIIRIDGLVEAGQCLYL